MKEALHSTREYHFTFYQHNFLVCFIIENKLPLTLLLYTFRAIEDFDILHGDVQGLPDTVAFLKSLSELDEKHKRRERKAAANLFNWKVLIISY